MNISPNATKTFSLNYTIHEAFSISSNTMENLGHDDYLVIFWIPVCTHIAWPLYGDKMSGLVIFQTNNVSNTFTGGIFNNPVYQKTMIGVYGDNL
jgi:hypothetical protein